MDNIREHIYLAALLHDIGKFYQRADTGDVKNSIYLKEHCKEESSFCPLYKGRYSHKHVLWTAQFIDENKSVYQNLVKSDLSDLSNKNNLINLAACHHLSTSQLTDLGSIIKEADCLSSGMDRESSEAYKDDQNENDWNAFKKIRMTPILQTVKQGVDEWEHLPVEALSLSKAVFPKSKFDDDPDYNQLWKSFVHDFKFIQANTYHAFSETLLNLLIKYTSCIPSSTINFPDVSLYDHLKTTAALSLCLYDVKQSGENPEKPFLLIGADFSGIQPYIYQIVSQYAGKNLKGRSFYLKLLSDSVVRYSLKKLNLFQANIVYNSGGGFYLLAPNTSATKKSLESAIKEIEKHLYDTFGTSLFVAIDSIEVSKNALMHKGDETIGTIWHDLFEKRDKKKNCKLASLIENNYSSFFTPTMQGGNTKRDTITDEEFLAGEKPIQEGDLVLKKTTDDQIKLGKILREFNVMVISEGDIPYWNNKLYIEPAELGFFYYFLRQEDLDQMKVQLRASADTVSVITLNGENGNCDFMGKIDGINNIYGLDFYGGNEYNGKTFEEMCENPNFSRLGILRMDVDNLGSIFQSGIDSQRATLSRYSALSRSFDFFFSGYLNTIQKEIGTDKSFIIYSGGDDIFIIGSWDVTIKIAHRIHDDFKEFTCNNPSFSISGGIAIVPAKFPIIKGAEESDNEEKNAKEHKCKGSTKNSISFMDMALNWEEEFTAVEELKDKIVALTTANALPKSFISKVLAHTANADIHNHKIQEIKTYWMMAYDFSRMRDRMKDKEAINIIDNCKTEVCGTRDVLNAQPIKTDYHPLELWAMACRWAELELRTNKGENNF